MVLIHFRSRPKEEPFRSASAYDACGLEESGFLYESCILLPAAVPCPGSGVELHTASSEPRWKVHGVCKTLWGPMLLRPLVLEMSS